MAEDFNASSLVLPGTYIRVRAEGLISVGGISTGNIGIVGTAAESADSAVNAARFGNTHILGDYRDAINQFGRYDAFAGGTGKANLVRGLEQLFANGARTIYARAVKPADVGTIKENFEELLKEDINILVVPELATDDAVTMLASLMEAQEDAGKDLIAVVGSSSVAVADIKADVVANKRLILAAPGIVTKETTVAGGKVTSADVTLPGNYTAACVAGLLSTLTPQTSPTNKVLAGVGKLSQKFSYSETKDLVSGGVLVLEERSGVRVVRGISTEMKDNGPFSQITTRRIVDFAKAGVRKAGGPFIGRLNNTRIRKALQGAIQGFLDTMVGDEALIGYGLEVTATRQDEIAGRAIVNLVLQPTFSIEFIAATIVLE